MKLKLGLVILVLVNLVVWLGPWLATMDPETIHWDHMAVPPDGSGRPVFVLRAPLAAISGW